jgi:methionyl-tRNA formyltransferase
MKKIKIGYFADGPWSHKAFELLNNDPLIEIAFIVPRRDTKDKTLLNFSSRYQIDYLENSSINSQEFINKVKNYHCDLFVSMSFNQIFRKEIFNIPPLKTINCHAGKLPFYRGRNILNWALINDENEFGITVHYIDEGIDTGDIILQRTYPISDDDDYASLLNMAHVECANILYDAICMIIKNEAKSIKQKSIHPVGMYCGRRIEGDELIVWNQTSREIFKPGPQATTFLDRNEIKINKVAEIKDAPKYKGKVGQVLCKTKQGTYFVKTQDSYIEIIQSTGKIIVGNILKSNNG